MSTVTVAVAETSTGLTPAGVSGMGAVVSSPAQAASSRAAGMNDDLGMIASAEGGCRSYTLSCGIRDEKGQQVEPAGCFGSTSRCKAHAAGCSPRGVLRHPSATIGQAYPTGRCGPK